ncbi:MAG: metalloprotease TldD [SAR324 cluster bacterium]|nr:metalloprotease TldD [SAR324 cluster bacterium]
MEMDNLDSVAGHHIESHFLNEKTPSQAAQEIFEHQMNVDNATIRKVLDAAMNQGGDFADLFFEYTLRNAIILEEGIIKNSSKAVIMGVGIRVLKGDQTGYAYSEDLDVKPMLHAARTAAAIAVGGKIKTYEAGQFNEIVPPNYYKILHSVTDLAILEKIQLLQEIENVAHSYDNRISKVVATLADSVKFIQIATSEGKIVRDTRPMFRMSVQCIAQEGDNTQTGFSGAGGRVGSNFLQTANQAKIIGEKAASQAIILLSAKQAPSGAMPVILGPAQSGILLHEAIGHPIEADFNRKGTSAYSGRLGETVASELCTIYDSGQIENDRGALNFDDEGNLSQKNVLIEQGVLTGYMHDRISSHYYDTNASGNGRRESYAYYPLPRMTTTYLANGESPPDEILRSVKSGVFCESFSGGQVDISNGDFVFVPTIAYMVEEGKCTYPIKNFTLIGNGPDALSKVSMVGNDFAFSEGIWTCGKDGQSVPVGVGLPTVLISELTVGGI